MTEYFSYNKAMEYMGIKAPNTLKKYIANGLPTIKVGNSKRISKAAIDEFMESHTVVAKQDNKADD